MTTMVKIFLLALLGGGVPLSAATSETPANPHPASSGTSVQTLMCTTESCADAHADTPGCQQYTTPLHACYNARTLFPGDPSWSDLDIYDELVLLSLKRTFYASTDGSCGGRAAGGSAAAARPRPVDGDDSFTLPFEACVGPFGPPRPWGKFTLLGDDGGVREVSAVE